MIGMVTINKKGFCKENIENMKNNYPGGSYLVLKSKPMVPGDMLLFVIGYKYNSQKVLYFVVTDNTGITKAGITYLYKKLTRFIMLPFALLLTPFPCINSLGMLTRLAPTTNKCILI